MTETAFTQTRGSEHALSCPFLLLVKALRSSLRQVYPDVPSVLDSLSSSVAFDVSSFCRSADTRSVIICEDGSGATVWPACASPSAWRMEDTSQQSDSSSVVRVQGRLGVFPAGGE